VVGSFPSATRRRRIAALLAALSIAAGALTSPLAQANDDLKDKQKQVQKKIDSAQADLTESSEALAAATSALREAQFALGEAQTRLAETRAKLLAAQIRDREMQRKLDQALEDLEVAREELRQGQADVEVQRVAVGDMVADMYENGSPDLMALNSFMEAHGLDDLTRAQAANDAISADENAVLDAFEAAEVLLTVKEARVEAKKDVVEVQRQKAADNLALMEDLEQQAEEEEAAVQVLVGERQSALAAAQRARRSDRVVLASLRQEEARIEAMLQRLAAQAAAAGGGSSGPSNGFLNWPVTPVRITSPFGYRHHPIYGYYSLHNGTDFGASCGQALYAGAGGTVVSRYYQTAYGNRLIINHGYERGAGLATIYNHATHYVVGVGDRVERGQVVGYVGSTGWSTGCHLHFTVMANGRAVDPMNWL
jgi:murein DD-endopeptidase MepM/ murein hydrolase activator NlpD